MSSRGVIIYYRDGSGRLVHAGKIIAPTKGSIPAGALTADFNGVPVRLQWRYDEVACIFAPDRVAAEKLVAAFGSKISK